MVVVAIVVSLLLVVGLSSLLLLRDCAAVARVVRLVVEVIAVLVEAVDADIFSEVILTVSMLRIGHSCTCIV